MQILVNNPGTEIHSADRLKDLQTLLNWRQPTLMKDILCSWLKQFIISKMSTDSKLSYRFNAVTIKLHLSFLKIDWITLNIVD